MCGPAGVPGSLTQAHRGGACRVLRHQDRQPRRYPHSARLARRRSRVSPGYSLSAAGHDGALDSQMHDHEADTAPSSRRQSDHDTLVQVCLRTGHSWAATHQHSAPWACVGTGSLSRALSGSWSASAVWPMPYNEERPSACRAPPGATIIGGLMPVLVTTVWPSGRRALSDAAPSSLPGPV